jgi:hypothetical protein
MIGNFLPALLCVLIFSTAGCESALFGKASPAEIAAANKGAEAPKRHPLRLLGNTRLTSIKYGYPQLIPCLR